jgi:hypothetical protein
MASEDPNDAPKADSVSYYKCDGCENLHVLLHDEDDFTIATATMSRDMLLHMLGVVDEPRRKSIQN